MSLTITVNGVDKTSAIRLDSLVIAEAAFGGEVGASGFVVDDEALGDVPAMKAVTIVESAASPTRMFTGYTSVRKLNRGELGKVASRRQWDVTILDLNTLLDDEVFQVTDANRPAETDYARVTWALSTPALLQALGVTAGVVPNTNTVTMEAKNYRGEGARSVFEDCAAASNKNYFLYNYGSGNKLYYDLATGTSLTSTLQLSSVAADVDNSTTFAVMDPKLDLDATGIYSAVDFYYEGGHVYVSDAGIESTYRRREVAIRDSTVTTAAAATARATAYLDATSIERQTFTASVMVPRAKVNDIRAGQRIPVKVPHLGISSNTYYRITRREVAPVGENYLMRLEFADNVLPVNGGGGGGSAGGGSGGGAVGSGTDVWTPFLDEDGSSLTNWTTLLGDWSVVGGEILGEVDVENTAILYYTERAPIAGLVFEAEMRGDIYFGLLVDLYPDAGTPEASLGRQVVLTVGSTNINFTDIPYVSGGGYEFVAVNNWTDPGTIADDVYYKLRVMRVGMWMNVWVDDELFSTFTPGEPYGVDMTLEYTPTGAINSVNTTFVLGPPYKTGTTHVYLNGQKLRRGTDYTENNDHVTITTTDAPTTGDTLWVEYQSVNIRAFDFVGLWVFGGAATANFRNIKAWRLTLP